MGFIIAHSEEICIKIYSCSEGFSVFYLSEERFSLEKNTYFVQDKPNKDKESGYCAEQNPFLHQNHLQKSDSISLFKYGSISGSL